MLERKKRGPLLFRRIKTDTFFHNPVFAALGLFLLFIVVFTGCSALLASEKPPGAREGVLDCSGWDFEQDGSIKLRGRWDFYWQKLLTPDELPGMPDSRFTHLAHLTMPGFWTGYSYKRKKLPAYGYGTLVLKIKLPVTSGRYGLKIPPMFTSYVLWVDGKEVSQNGKVGTSKKETKPAYFPELISFEPETDEITLVCQIANFHYCKGGMFTDIILGTEKQIRKERDRTLGLMLFIVCIFLITGFYQLLTFFPRRHDRSPLYFGLICIFAAVRIVSTGEHILMQIFPFFNWELLIKLEFISFYCNITLIVLLTQSLFPDEFHPIIKKPVLFTGALLLGIVILTPAAINSYAVWPAQCITLLYFLYITYIYFRAALHKREGALLFFITSLVLGGAVVNDILFYNSIVKTGILVPFGMLFCIICQAYVLTGKFFRVYIEVDRLSRELKIYSTELEEKVAERTFELKEANLKLERTNEQKSTFFVNIAHETKTPLTLIKNYLEAYINQKGSDYKLSIIKNNVDKLLTDSLNFLDATKLERNQLTFNHNQIVDISAFLTEKKEMFTFVAEKKQITITALIEPGLFCKADPFALDKICNNLIDNAVKYTGPGGSVQIELHAENEKEISFTVSDNGCGIEKKQLDTIFKPYYQLSTKMRASQGIGMGLFIVKNILGTLDSTINVESSPGEGTKFVVSFVRCLADEQADSSADYEVSVPLTYEKVIKEVIEENISEDRDTILLVEDNLEMLAFIQSAFKDEYSVYVAVNGLKGLERLKNMPTPDLIISDVMMDEMDGYQFYDELQKDPVNMGIPFIFLTAKSLEEETLKAIGKGAVDYIYKPFNIRILKAKVRSLIKNKKKQLEVVKTHLQNELSEFLNSAGNEPDEKGKIYEKLAVLCEKYHLSAREKEVSHQIIAGYLSKEIAFNLHISPRTVEGHIYNIYEKMGISNRVELLQLTEGE